MSLQVRISDLITSIGTDIKTLRTYITGSSSGTLTGLTTTDKSSIVGAINEVKAGSSGAPPDASTTVKGIVELADASETTTGTDTGRVITPAGLTSKMDTDVTLAGNSDTRIPSQKATKAYVDTAVAGATIADATTSVKGKVELALDAEAISGASSTLVVTPANVAAVFTDRIDTNVALGTSNTKVASQNATKTYVDGIIAAANAMVYKGVIDASTNPNYPAANAGDSYTISVAGKIGGASGQNVEVGDMILCKTDGTAAGTDATVGAQWNIIQKNIDGAVTGPASSTSGNLATYNGTSGKAIQDGGVAVSTDGTMASGVNTKLPTELAVKTYIGSTNYTKTELGNPETDLAALYATAKA